LPLRRVALPVRVRPIGLTAAVPQFAGQTVSHYLTAQKNAARCELVHRRIPRLGV